MKNLVFLLMALVVFNVSEAQKKKREEKVKAIKVFDKGKRVIGLNAGLSFTGLLYEKDKDSAHIKYQGNSKPAIQFTFDKFLRDRISAGFFGSVQSFRVDIFHWNFDTINPKKIEDLQAKMKRIYIGGRFLYHFKNTQKVDIYSGVRVGILLWSNKLPSTDPLFVNDFKNEFPQINRPSIGIIPIGWRIKIQENFAANIEINLAAPHLFSFGGSYTF